MAEIEQQDSMKMQNQSAPVGHRGVLGRIPVFFSVRRKLRNFRSRVDERTNLARHKMEMMLADYPNFLPNSLESHLDIHYLEEEIERDLSVVGTEMRNTIQRVNDER